ncbi:MAG: DUF359 domain-containing protein [Candidatus Marsarchaeota archaeon]
MTRQWVPATEDLERMRKPFGELYGPERLPELIGILLRLRGRVVLASVGDVVTSFLLSSRIQPEIAVFDGRTLRGTEGAAPSFPSGYVAFSVRNEAGSISEEALSLLKRLASSVRPGDRFSVRVEGEEDLLALPLIAYLEPRARVLYGQPGQGVVLVTGNAKKQEALQMMERMKVAGENRSGKGR